MRKPPVVVVKPNREKSLARRHPWIFSGALLRLDNEPESGDVVDVRASTGEWLGRGFYSALSQISVRLLTFDEGEVIDAAFFSRRLAAAWQRRACRWDVASHNAVRWVHGESDGLPGLIVDRYADVVCLQILTAGMERRRAEIVSAILETAPACTIYERSDAGTRVLEGLEETCGLLAGDPPPEAIPLRVHGIRWQVDVVAGHKTGCYLDQVDNWTAVGDMARGARVLDAFCFSGGFTLACLQAGASQVLALDGSREALAMLEANLAMNGLDAGRCERRCQDVFAALRHFRDRALQFDLIILDPPKFADSRGHVEKACRAYKDINLLALKLLAPGGRLATFSCSGSVTPELFQKVVADAALDARREARMIARFTQAPDHPVSLAFPEGLYLKGMLVQV